MTASDFRQLDIRWIDLDPVRGAETRKTRPCVIVQADILNRGSRTVIVAPLLQGHKDWPFVLNVDPSPANGIDKPRHINLKQLRAVDISRIGDAQGALEKRYLPPLLETVKIIFGIA